jgi:hypothetical protein
MTITTAAMALADQIEEAISSTRVTQGLLRLIQQQVQAPPGQEECVIESLFRCLISADIQRRYRIPTAEVSRWINSSHLRPRLACIKPQLHEHLQPPKMTPS